MGVLSATPLIIVYIQKILYVYTAQAAATVGSGRFAVGRGQINQVRRCGGVAVCGTASQRPRGVGEFHP